MSNVMEWNGRPLPNTASECQSSGGITTTNHRKGHPKMKVTTIGIDLAKNVFQIHGVDERGKVAESVKGAVLELNLRPAISVTCRITWELLYQHFKPVLLDHAQ